MGMVAQVIDGKKLAEQIRTQLQQEVGSLQQKYAKVPGLAVVLVGDNPASQVYVRNKIAACEQAGIKSIQHFLAKDTSEKALIQLIETLNQDPQVNGILVQLPLPAHLNSETILEKINPCKDVDGLHAHNLGNLLIGKECFKPCTPHGVMKMLESIHCDLAGKHCVVIGRSNIVGKPMALLLLEKHATVTICHSKTKNIPEEVKRADVVIAAVGRAKLVKGSWIKSGAVVSEVGINRDENGKLCGDVDYTSCAEVASYISPVPGGVGPMTIAMLLVNTVEAFKRTKVATTR